MSSAIRRAARFRASSPGFTDRVGYGGDRLLLGVAHPLAGEPEESGLPRLGDLVGEVQRELPVRLGFLRGRLLLEERNRVADVLEQVVVE